MPDQLQYVIRTYRRLQQAKTGTDEFLANSCLEKSASYRLPGNTKHDKLIGFRELIRTSRKIFRPTTAIHELNNGSHNAILGGLFVEELLITDYITKSSGEEQRLYIAKDFLPQLSTNKISFFLRWFLFALPLCFRCIFNSGRSNLALIIREVAENAGLLIALEYYGINHVYDFIPYEKDSNFVSLLLRGRGIRVTKIPSPGPVSTHNEVMIADEIVLSSPYQEEEVLGLRETIRATTFTRWIPERAFTYIHRYLDHSMKTVQGTIGFYSHGSWLRAEQGHADDGLGIAHAEIQLLSDLARFLEAHPQFQLTIFLHPKERKAEYREACDRFYAGFFKPGMIQFSDPGVATAFAFEQTDIAVAAFSTIVYERLFCGFKTLIGNYGIPGFPLPGSTLENICFDQFPRLEKLLLECASLTADQYFSQFRLRGYHYSEYPYFALRKTHS